MMTNIPVRLLTIEEAISRASGVSIEDIRRHNRDPRYAEARMVVWYIAFECLKYSYSYIARMYNRDHTTIIHGVDKMRKSKDIEEVVERVRKACPDAFASKVVGSKSMDQWNF
jgi:chromosomal replication initiator protein